MAARKLALLPAGARICGNEEDGAVKMCEKDISFYPLSRWLTRLMKKIEITLSEYSFFIQELHLDIRCSRLFSSCILVVEREVKKLPDGCRVKKLKRVYDLKTINP
jgi:hypothetical protein